MKLKVGILGCGKMGEVYSHWFSKNPNCVVKAFYNRTVSKAEKLVNLYENSMVYSSWQELIRNEDIDIIGICTPSHEHLSQFKLALECGKHVLCEKPMADDIVQCKEMINIYKKYNKKVMIGFQMQYHPVIGKVNKLIGEIGKIFHIYFKFGMYRPEITWKHKIIEKGGVLKELSSHLFDLSRSWLGELEYITAQNKIIQPGREVEDYSINLMEFKNGASGILISNYFDRDSRVIHGNILGTQGQIKFQFSSYDPLDSKVTLLTDDGKKEIKLNLPKDIDKIYPGHLDSFKKEIDFFIDSILHDKDTTFSCINGMKAIEIVDASYESQRVGEKISLPLKYFDTKNISECFKKY